MRNYFFLLNRSRRFSYGSPGLSALIKESLIFINLAIAYSLVFSHPSFIPYVYAGPTGGNVVGGAGSITQSGLMTTVNQTTGSMAINWDSYNLSANERVQYIQPGSSSISLNRILSHSGSQIHGRIDANGQVILVNPNGVFFGPTSQINVGGLIASGLDISPTNFMNGNYIFNEVLGTNGTVINNGLINASLGGNVALLGKQVINEGVISAKLGSVSLAAGKAAVLTFDNQGLLGVKITREILQNELGVDPAVLNSGEITAEGGRILLTASVSQDVFSQAVNSNGIEQATSVVVNDDGTFTLGGGSDVINTGGINVSTIINNQDAGQVVLLGENVTSSGVIKADSQNAKGGEIELHSVDTTLLTENSETTARSASNGKGGVVKVLGEKVGLLNSSTVDVSGSTGGGQALIGGDNKGLNKRIRNASRTLVTSGVNISADSLQVGDGGKIINWSDDITWFYGSASAKGGELSGNGGFVEISGSSLFFDGFVDTSAIHGQVGTLLFDPTNIVIHDKADGSQNEDDQLPDLSVVTAGSGNFDIGENALEGLVAKSTIILEATNDITINNLVDNELALQLTTGSITFTADSDTDGKGDFQMNAGDTIRTQGGSVTISGSDSVNIGSVNTTGGTGQSGGAINISTTAGDQVITIDGDLISNGGVASVSRAGNTAGIINVTASSSVTVNGKITANGSDGDATGVNDGGDGGAIAVKVDAAGTLVVNNSGTISSKGGNGANGGAAGSRDSVSLAARDINLNGVRDFIANNIEINASNRLAINNNLTLDQLSATSSLSGANVLNIAADIAAINSGSSLSFTSSFFITLDTNSNITTNNGNATFSGTVEILDGANNIVIDTGTGAGNINFTNAITSSDTGNLSTLSLTAGTGSVTIGGNVGTATNSLKAFSIISASSVDVGEIQAGDGGVTIDADTGNITLRGDVYSDNDTSAGAIDLTGNLILEKDNLRIDSGTDGSGAGNITITGNVNSDASDRALIFDADNGAVQVTGSTSVKSLLVEEADSVSFGSINTSRLNQVGGFVNIGSVTDIASSIITADIITQGLGTTVAGVGRDGGDITFNAKDITVGTLITRGSNASGIVPLTGGGKGGAIIIFADNAGGTKSITLNGDINTNSGVGVGVVAATPGAITMELNGAGSGVLNVNNVFGFTTAFTVTSNTGSIDTINGPDGFTLLGIDSTNSWSIDRANGGILNAKLTFENFEDIIGGSFDDSFTFTPAGSISGLIDGGGANIQDTVNVSSLTDVTVEIGNVTNSNINIVDIEQVIANAVGNNTLIADSNNAVNDWNIDRTNGGILNTNITFDGFRNLTGGSTDDSFTLTSLGSIAGLIDGGGENIQDTVDVSSLTDVTVEIGNVTNGNINIEQVIANAVGNNTLIADSNNAVNDWNIDRANGGILNTNITFDGFRNLSGGSTDDTFTFTSLGSIAGLIDGGGANIQDTVDVSLLTDVTVEIGNVTNGNINIVDIEQVIANSVGNNTLIADSNNAVNDWNIDRANGGILNTNITFDGFRNLSGGSTDDTFTFTSLGSIAGLIDGGGANIQDTVDVSSLTDVTVEIGNVTNGNINIVDIEQVIANAVGNNTLIADSNNAVNDWSIDRANGGILNANIIFDGFRSLSGGSTDDTFTFTSLGSIAGLIDGGGANIQDTVNVSSLTDVTVEIGNVTNGNINIVDIEQVIANAVSNNTLIADSNNAVNDWNIDRENGGILNTNITFDGFRNLTGGSTVDTFNVTPLGSVTGLVSGGAGDDVMTVELTGTQAGILDFDGGVDNDTITLTGGSSTYTGVYSETLTDVSFAYADNANSYTVAYENTETVQDELQANSLTVNGTGANDIVSLGTNTFVLGSGVEVTYSNKQNLIVAGLGGTDTVDIAGVINLPGMLEINAEEFTNTSSSVIMADTLFLNSVNTAGLSGQRILTNVTNLRLAGVTGDVFITETNAVDISELATTALFDLLVSAGDVTDSTGMVSNNTFNITANSGSVILDSANQLTGELSLSALNGNITLNNSDTLLMTVDAQDLSIISNSINNTVASQINVTNSTMLAANGQDIVLDAVGHRFTDLTVSNTADLTLVDSSALTINSVNVTGNADITAVGNVQLNSIRAGNSTTVTTTAAIIDVNGSAVNVTADKVKLRAASGIGSGDAIETSTAELDVINNGGGQVKIKNTGNVLLTNLVNNGDIDFKNDTNVTIDHVDAGFTVGTFRLDVANGSVFGVDRAGVNFFTVPDITADAAFVTVNGEFGTFARPIVLKLNSEFFLASTVSSTFFIPQPPPVVNDTSDLQLSVFDSLNSVSGQRLIEIESLADINPAIFTDLHNYNQENISIRLPRDQMFDDELENYDRL